jgi:hypothetical protein
MMYEIVYVCAVAVLWVGVMHVNWFMIMMVFCGDVSASG